MLTKTLTSPKGWRGIQKDEYGSTRCCFGDFLFFMTFVPFKKTHNYFVHELGYVFKIENGKEVILPITISKRTKVPHVLINGVSHKLFTIMFEHFIGDIKATDNYKFKVGKQGRISAKSIRVKPFISSELSIEQEALMNRYNCSSKANAANYRSQQHLTPLQVFLSLEIHNFKCIYCAIDLPPMHWHLDHFHPLAQGGLNVFQNIVPSCAKCNIMKGALNGDQFFRQCEKISKSYAFINSLENLRQDAINDTKRLEAKRAAKKAKVLLREQMATQQTSETKENIDK